MATAVLAVLVAALALLRPPTPPLGETWRTVHLRDGRSFIGKLERLDTLPDGDANLRFRLANHDATTVKASRIRRLRLWRPLPWVQLSAALVAAVALVVALIVVLQSRKENPARSRTP